MQIPSRAVIIATGAEYRRPALANLSQFEGAGVYYGATPMEAQLCIGEEVVVIGGGNAAGQAAVFLAQSVKHVHMLIRAEGLADTMSRYLIRRIEESPAITLHTHTELAALQGDGHLEQVRWRDNRNHEAQISDIRHVFVMTGGVPNTAWLGGCVALDSNGFIKTGPDLSREDLVSARWPLNRPPYLLETSRPGVFAVGDVRGGNIKRVASAVGEGAIAVGVVRATRSFTSNPRISSIDGEDGSNWPLRLTLALCAWKHRFRATTILASKERLQIVERRNGPRAVLHQAARICRRSVVAVQLPTEHPQHGHLLASMV